MNATLNVRSAPVDALASMTRAQVDALTEAERDTRRQRLRKDRTPWTLTDISRYMGHRSRTDPHKVSRAAVARWRRNYLNTGLPGVNALCAPMNEPAGAVRRPDAGDDGRPRGDAPLFYAGDVRTWAADLAERADADLFPYPEGRKRPGRTPTNPVAASRPRGQRKT